MPSGPTPKFAIFNRPLTTENLFSKRNCNGEGVVSAGVTYVDQNIESDNLNSGYVRTNALTVTEITNNGPINVYGTLILDTLQVQGAVDTAALLTTGLKSWNLLQHHSFQTPEDAQGWSFAQIGSCDGDKFQNKFLGGPCLLNTKISKGFKDLPDHSMLRLVATVHLFDDWDGESIMMQVDGKKCWSKTTAKNKGVATPNFCGNPQYGDPQMNLQIDHTFEHTGGFVEVGFNSNMKKDACQASYAVDDVFLYYQ